MPKPIRRLEQRPWTHKPEAFFEALDLPAIRPEQWAKQLELCGGDAEAAREIAVNILVASYSPIHGPITQAKHEDLQAFKVAFGQTFLWDHRRFLHDNRKTMGKRTAMRYWRAMTKGVRP